MTIALCLKVSDGAVFGADSAATIYDSGGERVYTNAEKIVNLHKDLPIGLVTYGLGGLGGRSTTTLAKDLRQFFSEPVDGREDFVLDPQSYAIEEVAGHVREYFYSELYAENITPLIEQAREESQDPEGIEFPAMGFLVAGISSGGSKSEIWSLEVDTTGRCSPAERVDGDRDGAIVYRGWTEPLDRLLQGTTASTFAAGVHPVFRWAQRRRPADRPGGGYET